MRIFYYLVDEKIFHRSLNGECFIEGQNQNEQQ